ncbi:MAG: DNA internalization-related competence protein ComEC/Rec2, partial [Gammaproteobacteria bacterium]|nr:DNA internalization-related competence protein ComEC/Rec2 [Gammaproteobacteria bacterium]
RLGSRLQSNVLIAPHHGSMTSSTEDFIDAVAPQTVLFPVGYVNRFNFPRTEIVKRYEQRGINHYNTDDTGAITLILNEKGIGSPQLYRQQEIRAWHIH